VRRYNSWRRFEAALDPGGWVITGLKKAQGGLEGRSHPARAAGF